MKRRLVVAVTVGMVAVCCFAAAAWASTQIFYGSAGTVFNPGEGVRTGWTGHNWTENHMTWSDPEGGTPNMCSNYIDTSGVKYLSDKCSGSGLVDDTRVETNYAAAVCWSSTANNFTVKLTGNGCWAIHD